MSGLICPIDSTSDFLPLGYSDGLGGLLAAPGSVAAHGKAAHQAWMAANVVEFLG